MMAAVAALGRVHGKALGVARSEELVVLGGLSQGSGYLLTSPVPLLYHSWLSLQKSVVSERSC